ncbi:hypothetical protein OH76DRAFT_1333850, partial [Lentinus brumalis]
AVWTPAQEQRLLAFLTKHKSEAGDGGLFKMTTYNAAATYLNNKKYTGATKTGEICKNKYNRLRSYFWAVQELKGRSASGFSYDDELGAGITKENEQIWEDYVKSHKYASPFKNKGFAYYDLMLDLMPSKAKGGNV